MIHHRESSNLPVEVRKCTHSRRSFTFGSDDADEDDEDDTDDDADTGNHYKYNTSRVHTSTRTLKFLNKNFG